MTLHPSERTTACQLQKLCYRKTPVSFDQSACPGQTTDLVSRQRVVLLDHPMPNGLPTRVLRGCLDSRVDHLLAFEARMECDIQR